jgi:transcriptional regulator with XRE-family HTH domain
MNDGNRPGQRIAATRKSLGLTQQQLADRANVSKSMLAKVESGHATASNVWVGAVAHALGVDPAYLFGQPYDGGTPDNAAIHQLIPAIRRAVAMWDLGSASADEQRTTLDSIAWDVRQLHKWRHATAYDKIGQELPRILAVLTEHTQLAAGADRELAFALLTQAYRAANTMAHKLGYTDLSLAALDRMEWAASQSGDPVLVAVVDYVRSGALSRLGEHNGAVRLLTRAINSVEPLIDRDRNVLPVLGSLHMKLIGVYGAMANGELVATHTAEATRIAAMTGPDRPVYETVFGPANVQLHALSARVDMAQPAEALEVADATRLPEDMARERVTYYWTDLARAHLLNGNPDAAIEALYEARTAAPTHFANSSLVRGTIYTLAAEQRRATRGLRSLAHSIGIRD